MPKLVDQAEPASRRRVFPQWSISIPEAFQETFDFEGNYWHAWDRTRSVSLTSLILTDRKGRRVRAREILATMPRGRGEPVSMPAGLSGWATIIKTDRDARASRAVSGIVVVDGAVLIATVTSDDVDWAKRVWHSIERVRGSPAR
jgi:hypothetical protein